MTGVRRAPWIFGVPTRALLIGLIRIYRVSLSGLLGGQCRFHPTCSRYAEEAIRVHGAVKGTALTAWRIARCGPFTRGGVDPLPPRRSRSGVSYDAVILKGERPD